MKLGGCEDRKGKIKMQRNRGGSSSGSGMSGEVAEHGHRIAEADGESSKSLDIERGTSPEGAGRSRDFEYRRREGQ
jgi:hypothetical protein